MSPDDADLIFALESCEFVDGVYAIPAARPGWPRIFVALHEDTGHALGTVTGLIVRALPHRDRSYILSVPVLGPFEARGIWMMRSVSRGAADTS